jgi:hypothetical protein
LKSIRIEEGNTGVRERSWREEKLGEGNIQLPGRKEKQEITGTGHREQKKQKIQ